MPIISKHVIDAVFANDSGAQQDLKNEIHKANTPTIIRGIYLEEATKQQLTRLSEALSTIDALKILTFSAGFLDGERITALTAHLPTSITSLAFESYDLEQLTDEECAAFAVNLGRLNKLTDLSISGCNLTATKAKYIIPASDAIKILSLEGNPLGSAGDSECQLFATSLTRLPALGRLNLPRCELSETQAAMFVKTVATSRFSFDENRIRSTQPLKDAAQGKAILYIKLRENRKLPSDQIEELTKMLAKSLLNNPTPMELSSPSNGQLTAFAAHTQAARAAARDVQAAQMVARSHEGPTPPSKARV